MTRRQRGLTTVEFAVAGTVILLVLIGCIEMGRMLFVWNTIGEATRRAARIAAVCPVNDPAIKQAALLDSSGSRSSSRFIPGLTPSNVAVTYLDSGGAETGTFTAIRYVRVEISDYTHQLLIPLLAGDVPVPAFQTTIPVESLGLVPETGERIC